MKKPIANNPEAFLPEGMIEKLVQQELAKRGPQETPEKIQEPQEQTITLDEDDGLRLQLLILKRHNEELQRALENKRRETADSNIEATRADLQNHLVEKYNIDTTKYAIQVDAKTYQLHIQVKDAVGPNDEGN